MSPASSVVVTSCINVSPMNRPAQPALSRCAVDDDGKDSAMEANKPRKGKKKCRWTSFSMSRAVTVFSFSTSLPTGNRQFKHQT